MPIIKPPPASPQLPRAKSEGDTPILMPLRLPIQVFLDRAHAQPAATSSTPESGPSARAQPPNEVNRPTVEELLKRAGLEMEDVEEFYDNSRKPWDTEAWHAPSRHASEFLALVMAKLMATQQLRWLQEQKRAIRKEAKKQLNTRNSDRSTRSKTKKTLASSSVQLRSGRSYRRYQEYVDYVNGLPSSSPSSRRSSPRRSSS
ncbi:hypothetical protein OC835_006969 [Tilletia horrida]|nr:hypothetical protein OC835_006969 [Tilletia horrida]KAK0549499.1 hypothetical protein OC844_006861 [Tilletia horrida]